MGVATTRAPLMVWGFQTQPKSWPTGWTVWANHYLEITFWKFSGGEPPPLNYIHTHSFPYIRLSELGGCMGQDNSYYSQSVNDPHPGSWWIIGALTIKLIVVPCKHK